MTCTSDHVEWKMRRCEQVLYKTPFRAKISEKNAIRKSYVMTSIDHRSRKEKTMKESELERRFTDTVKHKGGLALKFVSPGYDGMPDRLVLFENGRMGFVEVKAPGKKPRHLQAARHRMLRMMGYKVFVLDSEDDMERMADEIRTA